jgi:hypothetical protein
MEMLYFRIKLVGRSPFVMVSETLLGEIALNFHCKSKKTSEIIKPFLIKMIIKMTDSHYEDK